MRTWIITYRNLGEHTEHQYIFKCFLTGDLFSEMKKLVEQNKVIVSVIETKEEQNEQIPTN